MSKNSTKTNKTASATNNQPVKNPADMTIEELIELKKSAKGVMVAIIEALIDQKTMVADLQSKVKTTKKSANRQTKVLTDEETLLFPLVKAVYRHEKAAEVINHAAKLVKITITATMVEAWVRASIRHNSHSNIAKLADSKGKVYGYDHFAEMLSTFATLLKSFDKATGELLADSTKLTLFEEVESNSAMPIKHDDVTAAKDILDIAYAVAE